MNRLFTLIGLVGLVWGSYAQTPVILDDVEPGRFDQGKMWTFENPPVDYFKEAYNFNATPEWMEDARKSALRFASWCSASFISEDGLILTNHHCSRGVTASVMKEGENFDKNGFYAATLAEERRAPGLYVDQMVKLLDVTADVQGMSEVPADSALKAIVANLKDSPDWQDLHIETRTFYSGGKYSVYGFKRYNDIRLVLYPELAMGYYGGDPDNFTYPRYNLDFSLWRAYDEDGKPLKPTNYFEFNEKGAQEDELVFVIGNPGSTGRYLTMAQLYYMRDISLPAVTTFLKNRMDILLAAADGIEDVYEKDSVVNLAFGYSNSLKAYSGQLKGMKNPVLMTKKLKKEKQVRANITLEGEDPWAAIDNEYNEYGKYFAETLVMSPNGGTRGRVSRLIFLLSQYKEALNSGNDEGLATTKEKIDETMGEFETSLERTLFSVMLEELSEYSQMGYMDDLLKGKSAKDAAFDVFESSLLLNNIEKFYKLSAKKLDKEPLIAYADALVPAFQKAVTTRRAISAKTKVYSEKISNLQFSLTGLTSPPDATFSLRLADGVVKGYDYNGTRAPVFTTYFGLYDRHYSFNKQFPWNLPEKWENPPMELLKSPLNFVCTADIIGGNSGSPVINAKQEVVGLVFDGNIESLPGYFIYDNTYNRTVAVHAGGIAAALRYIYKADRIVDEITK